MSKSPLKSAHSLLGILVFLRRYPVRCAACVLLLLVNIGIEMSLPQILGNAITNLRWRREWGADFAGREYTLLFVALVLVRAGVGHILGPTRNRLVQQTLGDIRGSVYDTIQRLSFRYHDSSNTGELISRSTADVWRMQDFLYACLFLMVDIGVTLAVILVLIFQASPRLGWLTVAAVVPTVALLAYYSKQLQPQWRKVHDLHGAMTTVVQENIAGVRVVKAFARESAEVRKFQAQKQVFLDTLMTAVNFWAARVPFAQFIFGLGMPLVMWVGGRQVIRGELLIGDLVKVVFYLMAIGHRMGSVGQFAGILQNASASAERILEIIHEPRRLKSGRARLSPGGGEVVFENVSFHYQEGKPALEQVSFKAERGKTYAIVGPTGSGKSTLAHLVARYYDPDAGRVLIDGLDARELDLASLRRGVGIVFQETFLFSATVRENIAFGRPGASAAEVERCARGAQAHEFIMALDEGYDTVIGERGVTLSGGQKQRIAIARAFLMDPRILILDDATASVDSQTERLIQEAIRELCAGRTAFVIAQRLSTVRHADEILALNRGRLVAKGSHAELMATSEDYARLWSQSPPPPEAR